MDLLNDMVLIFLCFAQIIFIHFVFLYKKRVVLNQYLIESCPHLEFVQLQALCTL